MESSVTGSADSDTDIERLHAEIDTCTVCAREVGAGYEKIVGLRRGDRGNIVVIGEQPGRNEAARAAAFAGPAGTVLNRWLIASGASSENPRRGVYTTSLVKCISPKREIAFRRMVRNCRPFLTRQLALLRPRLIITLGRHAYSWFRDGDRTYNEALCDLFESSSDPLLSRHDLNYVVMPWPHPSPSNNRLLARSETRLRLEGSFRQLRPYFEDLTL